MAIILLLSLIIGTVLVELALRTFGGDWFRSQIRKMVAQLRHYRAARTDDERQRLVLSTGIHTLKFSMVSLGWVCALITVVMLAPWTLQWDETKQTTYFVVVSVVASAWWLMRYRHVGGAFVNSIDEQAMFGRSYSGLDRWLHWIALEPSSVRRLSFDLERKFACPKSGGNTSAGSAGAADGAVYVCGLARSGTTMLLRILDQVEVFRSLSYRDMPFVLAPNLWKQVMRQSRKEARPAERAHGDGIVVDFDSPEAFEEVFWRTFSGKVLDERCLGTKKPSKEVLAAFADYRALVANPKTERINQNQLLRRYLSKNNNNLLRLESLCADSTATALVVYRNPMDTARSLLRQHKRFLAVHRDDSFSQTYMAWLSHHEFGPGHRPFCFALDTMNPALSPESPDYWLDYWNAIHHHILDQENTGFHLIDHDAMRERPEQALEAIFSILGVEADISALAQQIKPSSHRDNPENGFDTELLHQAGKIHKALQASNRNLLEYNK